MNKKILFVVTQAEFGGAQRFLLNLTTSLDKNKYKIKVVSGREGDDEKGLLSILENKGIKIGRLRYLKRAINPFFDFLGLLELRRLVKKEKPNTLFLCSSKAGFLGSLSIKLSPKSYTPASPAGGLNPKVVYRIGGWSFNDPRSSLGKWLYKFIEKLSAKWKNIIIVNSEHDLLQAQKLKIKPKNKIVNVYNGVEITESDFFSREKAREFLGLSEDDFVIGTIANDYPAKGLKYLKKASQELKNKHKLIIIGQGHKFITNAHKYLKAFDIFVLPSVKEGFPWVVLEAMSAGLPIVATKVGAVPEILTNPSTRLPARQASSGQVAILVEPGNVKEMVEAIDKLVKSQELRNKISKRGRELVADKFSLDKMVEEIEGIINE